MSEHFVVANGVEICTERFGDPADPTVLLIMGSTASMIWWPDDFCESLASRGFCVIRYDHRDTGRSITYEAGTSHYSLDDLAADALGVLDAYQIKRAGILGMSLGGMLAQIIDLQAPERVRWLVLLLTSIFGPEQSALPPVGEPVMTHVMAGKNLDWANREAAIQHMTRGWELITGPGRLFDEVTLRERANREYQRAVNLRCMLNHSFLKGGESSFGRTKEIQLPTTVIHGTTDPALTIEHGVALAAEISGSKFVRLVGAGHDVHPDDWKAIADEVVLLNDSAS